MIVYRITRAKYSNDLSGHGAELWGGRWNSKGIPVLYTASTASLALLETLAWTSLKLLLKSGFVLIEIEVPEESTLKVKVDDLPTSWQHAAQQTCQSIGDSWALENKYLSLLVPSAILPFESNVLINPSHSTMRLVAIRSVYDLILDERVLGHLQG